MKPPTITERRFRGRGENEYSLELLPAGITFHITRLRRSSHELWGELSVSVTNGHFPHAKTVGGILSSADMNFSSANARLSRAKLLKERCGSDGDLLDWFGFLEELSIKSIEAERHGEPAQVLADVPKSADDVDSWICDGFPVLKRHPTVLFGPGAAGKSYLAMWIAGQLATQGIPVLYIDCELAGDDHRTRLERLFQPPPRGVHYLRCVQPLREQVDRVGRLLQQHQCGYAVFDSVGPASRGHGGRFQDADLGQEYFGLVRQFGVGSLHVAHPPKHVDEEKDATVFGSAFFGYLARSIWFVHATENNPANEIVLGLYHHKLTTGPKLAPLAYRLSFLAERTLIEQTELKEIDELAAKLPLLARIQQKLERGPLTIKVLAGELDVPQNSVRKVIMRHSSTFTKLDKLVALASSEERF